MISSTVLHRIKPLMIHAPAAPVFLTDSMFCEEIPPIAYTGILTVLQISSKKGSPLPGNPFLQSVRKMCPAVILGTS